MNRVSEKVIFLDRDGVINRRAPLHKHITEWKTFKILDGVPEAIRIFNEIGFVVIVLTNQSCIARGTATTTQVEDLHKKMVLELGNKGAMVNKVVYCPHDNGECSCRKPGIGMFLEVEKSINVNKKESYMIGDSPSDIEAGRRYGIKTISIGSKISGSNFDFANLLDCANFILREQK